MPTPTYTPLAEITLGSSAASVTFSSISQAYRDLVLVANTNSTGTPNVLMRLNGDSTASAYTRVVMTGNGSSASSSTFTDTYFKLTQNAAAAPECIWIVNIMDYSATDKHKSILARGDNSSLGTDALAGRWVNTSAITSMLIYPQSGSWAAGSTFALYGIAA